MENNYQSSDSTFKVSEKVIISVIKSAVSDVEGVAGICGDKKFPEAEKAVKLSLNDDFPQVTVRILVTPSCKVCKVCESVQNKVRDDVMSMTGIALSKVNVRVDGIFQPVV